MSNNSRRAKRQRIKAHQTNERGCCGFRQRGAKHKEGAHHQRQLGQLRHAVSG